MKIKNTLSLYFALTGSGVLLVVLISIYFSFYSIIHNHFYTHLNDRANIAAQLYLEADEITADSLTHVRDRFLKSLPGEVIRLYDSRNSATFIKEDKQYWGNNVIERVREHKYLQYNYMDHQVVGIYYKDNQGNFVILVSAQDVEGAQQLRSIIKTMVLLFFVVAITLFLVSRWLAKKALKPINVVVKQMQLIKSNNLNLRVDEGRGKDEISELAHNFNRLLEHLENAFEIQKTYVASASHELRTPVTSIIGEVELALSGERSREEDKKTMQLVLEESERLNDTISGLMELAQVDMYTIAESTPVRMDELLWEVHEYWKGKPGSGALKINIGQLPEDEERLTINANRQLLFIALNNLIANAFKFSAQQPVTCNFSADGQLITIQVTDTGIGIPQTDLERIFKSFYRGSNTRNFPGSGIGLYVTNKIIRLFNGTISITSAEHAGTTITVIFRSTI